MSPVVIVIAFAVLILSLSFHEAAHAWTANQLGDPTARRLGRLTLNPLVHIDPIGTVLFPLIAMFTGFPLIGWAKPVPVSWANLKSPRRDFAIVALAGPASNIVLAVGASLVMNLLEATGQLSQPVLVTFVQRALELNVVLAVFNLIPVPPLDGGNVLMGVVPEAAAKAIDRLRPFGILILYALMFSGVFNQIVFPIAEHILGWLD